MHIPKMLPPKIAMGGARLDREHKESEMRDSIAYGVLLTLLERDEADVFNQAEGPVAERAYRYADAMLQARKG